MEQQKKANKKTTRRIIFTMAVLGILCFVVIGIRLFKLQVVDNGKYKAKAESQQTKDITVYAHRGTIYDTNMKALAVSVDTYMVTLEAVKIDDEQQGLKIASFLSELLELDYDSILGKVQARSTYAVIKRGVDDDTAALIRAFVKENKLDSIYLVKDSTRYYPYGSFLAQVLGFVGTDQQGLYGLEYQYDEILTGVNGRIITSVNAAGDEMPESVELYYEAQDGADLHLTIDEVLQHYLEKELTQAIADNEVNNQACGIVMDVRTGAILAMATKGDFDPNDPMKIADEQVAAYVASITDDEQRASARTAALYAQWKNKAIADTYYPGSTFKIVTAAMLLEEDASATRRSFECDGITNVYGTDIRCWKYPRTHGIQGLAEALQNSCNCAFIEIGQRIGITNFSKYFEAYGLREKTGIDLPGEGSGIFFSKMGPVDLAVSSFGQGFTVTPLQLVTAVSACINGGYLYQPYVVKSITDSNGNVIKETEPTVVRQVNSEYTSSVLREYVESVVKKGTGSNAYTIGYRVAGKTGTSEKIGSSSDKEEYVASFIAFAPADDPQICVLILIDQPQVYPYTGGITVAPVIRRFMSEALPYLGVEAVYTDEELQNADYVVRDFTGMQVSEAKSKLDSDGIKYKVEGSGSVITDQMPAAGSVISKLSTVVLYAGSEKDVSEVLVPDVSGMSVENARRTLENIGLYIKTEGLTYSSGGNIQATHQSAVGVTVPKGTVITVEFSDLSLTSH